MKLILFLLILPITLFGQQPVKVKVLWATDSIYSGTNIIAKDSFMAKYLVLERKTTYPINPRKNTIINYKDTFKYYNGSIWKQIGVVSSVGFGLFVRNDSLIVDSSKVATLRALMDSIAHAKIFANGGLMKDGDTIKITGGVLGSDFVELKTPYEGMLNLVSDSSTFSISQGSIVNQVMSYKGDNMSSMMMSNGMTFQANRKFGFNTAVQIDSSGIKYINPRVEDFIGDYVPTVFYVKSLIHDSIGSIDLSPYKLKADTTNPATGMERIWSSDDKLKAKINYSDTTVKVATPTQLNLKVDKTTTINNKALSSNIRLSARRDFLLSDTASNDSIGLMSPYDHSIVASAITGSGTANQIPFFNSIRNLISNAFFTADSSNKKVMIIKNNLGLTPSGGIELFNNTDASVGVQVQVSPQLLFKGSNWNTGTSQAYTNLARIRLVPISAGIGTAYANFTFEYSNNNGASYSEFLGYSSFSGSLNTTFGFSAATFTVNKSTSSGLTVPSGFLARETFASTSGSKVNVSPSYLYQATNWNGSVSRNQYFRNYILPIADSEQADWLFQYSYDGGTNHKTLFGIRGTFGVSTANNFWMGEGTSQSAPTFRITSADKSAAIQADANGFNIISDNTGKITFGFDSKANIDNVLPTLNSTGMILNNNGYLYRHSVATDSVYLVKKQIDQAISFATTGQLQYVTTWDASGGLWPSTGVGGGSINIGDWWNISVGGTINGLAVSAGDHIYALTNTPGQTNSNWDKVGSTTTIPIGRTAGSSGNGFVDYSGRTKVVGKFNGGTLTPSSVDSTLNFEGVFQASQIASYVYGGYFKASSGAYALSAITTGTTTIPFRTESASEGTADIANFNKNGIGTVAKVDYTGKGTFNGGVQLGSSTNNTTVSAVGNVTLNGAAKVWDDIEISGFNLGTGLNAPAFTTGWAGSGSLGAYYFQGTTANDIAYFNVQIPHRCSENDSITIHVHGGPTTTPGATDSVVLVLTYSYSEIGGTFPAASTKRIVIPMNGKAQWSQNSTTLLTLPTGTGNGISGIYNCSIERQYNDASDTYTSNWGLLSIDCHAKIAYLGSRQIGSK